VEFEYNKDIQKYIVVGKKEVISPTLTIKVIGQHPKFYQVKHKIFSISMVCIRTAIGLMCDIFFN